MFNKHTMGSLYRNHGHGTSVVHEVKMGKIVPGAGIKLTSLPLYPSVLPLHHLGFLISCPPLYATPCLRGKIKT